MKQLPIVAYSAFCNDYPNLNKWECMYYYKEQCAIKFVFGISAKITFIKTISYG